MKTISKPTYVLRTCDNDLQGYDGFQWPEKGYVEAPDWNPEPVCGGGLHGLLMGKGLANLLNWYSYAIWQVVEVQEDTIVWIGNDQVKFPYGNVIYSGNRKDATDLLISLGADKTIVPGAFQIGGDYSTLTGGDFSTVQGGDWSTVHGDEGSFLQGGDHSTLQGGDYSTLQGGDFSNVQGGQGSILTGGKGSTLQGGRGSTLQGGVGSTVQGGDFSTLYGGDGSTLTGGKGSNLTGGNRSILTGGGWSKFKAGEKSFFEGSYWKDGYERFVTAYVGERGIKADTWYRFDNDVFTEVVDN